MKITKAVKKGSYPSFCKGFRFASINFVSLALAKFHPACGFPWYGKYGHTSQLLIFGRSQKKGGEYI